MTSKRDELLAALDKAAELGMPTPASTLLDLARQDTEEAIRGIETTIQPEELPLFTLTEPGAVPPPRKLNMVLGSKGWEPFPYSAGGRIGGGGTTDHHSLIHLDYASSGHTGFQQEAAILNALMNLPDALGWLQNDGAGTLSWTVPAGGGDVFGPASAVDGNFAAFDLATGKLIKDSGYSFASFAPALGPDDNYVTDAEKLALHPAITLDVNADTLLSLSTQELGLDTQAANRVLAGPAAGIPAVPTFRVLDAADIPALGYQPPGNYITALTGDGAATGPGSAAFTLNSLTHSFSVVRDAFGYIIQKIYVGWLTITITRDANHRITAVTDGTRIWTPTFDGNGYIASVAVT